MKGFYLVIYSFLSRFFAHQHFDLGPLPVDLLSGGPSWLLEHLRAGHSRADLRPRGRRGNMVPASHSPSLTRLTRRPPANYGSPRSPGSETRLEKKPGGMRCFLLPPPLWFGKLGIQQPSNEEQIPHADIEC